MRRTSSNEKTAHDKRGLSLITDDNGAGRYIRGHLDSTAGAIIAAALDGLSAPIPATAAGDKDPRSPAHRLLVSMGIRKSPLDNAAMESWFASLKTEEIYPNGMPVTRSEAASRLFAYIWIYNTKRLHSTLDYQTPLNYAILNK